MSNVSVESENGLNVSTDDVVVINEVLCYVSHNIHNCTKEDVIKAAYRHFDLEEIHNAKRVLYDNHPFLGEFPRRITSTNRTEIEAHAIDIVCGLIEIDTNHAEENQVVYVAKNLSRLPRWSPNEINQLALADKLAQLEGRFQSLEYAVSENKANGIQTSDIVRKIDQRLEKVESDVSVMGSPVRYADVLRRSAGPRTGPQFGFPTLLQERSRQPHPGQGPGQGAPPPATSSAFARPQGNATAQGGGSPGPAVKGGADAEGPGPATEDDNDDTEVDNEHGGDAGGGVVGDARDDGARDDGYGGEDAASGEFVFQRDQRLRLLREARRRRGVVTGTAGAGRPGFRGAPPPRRQFFLYRVAPGATEQDICEYLNEMNIAFVSVKLMSKPYAFNMSFKLEVPVEQASRVMEPDVWPEGVLIRKFDRYPRRPFYGRQPDES